MANSSHSGYSQVSPVTVGAKGREVQRMQSTTVRSYLTVGMAAVVVVGAIALAPVESGSALSPVAVPLPVVAEIALTGLTLPFTDIVSLLQSLGIGSAIPNITSLLPADLANAIATEFLIQATPLITAAASDVFAAFNSTIAGLVSGPDSIVARFGGSLAAIPTVLITAIQSVSTGDLPAALQTLTTGLIAPITSIGQAISDASQSFQSFVTAQINSVTLALPGVLLAAVSTVVQDNVQSVLAAVQNAISTLTFGLIPRAAASVSPAAAVTAARVAMTAAVPSVSTVPVSVSVALRPAAAQRERAVAVVADVTEPPAPPVVPDQTVAPVPPRQHSVVRRVARSESAISAPAAASQPKQSARARAAHAVARVTGSE